MNPFVRKRYLHILQNCTYIYSRDLAFLIDVPEADIPCFEAFDIIPPSESDMSDDRRWLLSEVLKRWRKYKLEQFQLKHSELLKDLGL